MFGRFLTTQGRSRYCFLKGPIITGERSGRGTSFVYGGKELRFICNMRTRLVLSNLPTIIKEEAGNTLFRKSFPRVQTIPTIPYSPNEV